MSIPIYLLVETNFPYLSAAHGAVDDAALIWLDDAKLKQKALRFTSGFGVVGPCVINGLDEFVRVVPQTPLPTSTGNSNRHTQATTPAGDGRWRAIPKRS